MAAAIIASSCLVAASCRCWKASLSLFFARLNEGSFRAMSPPARVSICATALAVSLCAWSMAAEPVLFLSAAESRLSIISVLAACFLLRSGLISLW